MWRNIVKFLVPMPVVNSNLRANFPRVLSLQQALPSVAFGVFYASTVFKRIDIEENSEPPEYSDKTNLDELQFTPEMRHIFEENGEAVRELIETLNACIVEISEQYQHCIARQIDILVATLHVTKSNAQYFSESSSDDLVKYRVHASDLQYEFNKYKMLIDTVGLLIKNDNTRFNNENRDREVMNKDFENLVHLVNLKWKENRSWDQKLLNIHAQSVDSTNN